MLIGVISDTHVTKGECLQASVFQLQEAIFQVFKDVDLIMHAGDIFSVETLKQLSTIAPVVAVAGNGDSAELAHELGYQRTVYAQGLTIGLAHGHHGHSTPDGTVRSCAWFKDADIVIGGHTHLPVWEQQPDGVWFLNPGSTGVPKVERGASVALLTIEGSTFNAEIIYLDEV